MRNRRELVTENLLERELNSKEFIGSIDQAINITQKTNYETQFTVYKKAFERRIFYDDSIKIGNENSVGPFVGYKRVRAEFEKTNGIKHENSPQLVSAFYLKTRR